ncbi:MAG: Hpt domain-containing protein, partial [Clostridia bacterium]
MDKIIECLKEYGADIDGAMGRFIGDTDLYKSCFSTFIADDAFLKLGEALNAMDYDMAFEYAHSLKGTTGNMGLTPL